MSTKTPINITITTLIILILLTLNSFFQSFNSEGLALSLLITILSIAAFIYHGFYLIKNEKGLNDLSATQENQHHFPNKIYLSFIVYFLLFLEALMNISILINYSADLTFWNTLFQILKAVSIITIIWLSYRLMILKNFKDSLVKKTSFDFVLFFVLMIISLVCIPILESLNLSIGFLTLLFIHITIVYFPLIFMEWIRYRDIGYVLTLIVGGLFVLPLSYSVIRSNSSSTNFTLITFPLFATGLTIAIIYFFIIFQKKIPKS